MAAENGNDVRGRWIHHQHRRVLFLPLQQRGDQASDGSDRANDQKGLIGVPMLGQTSCRA